MKTRYTLSSLGCSLLLLVVAINGQAQNWNLGQPVNEHLNSLTTTPWAGCYPTEDTRFYFPMSQAAGVQFIAIVTAATPANSIDIVPGLLSADVGDTLFINNNYDRDVFFPTQSGLLTLEFYAIGTPTNVGDPHPCTYNDLWMSNLGICPEGLNPVIPFNCEVDAGTGIPETTERNTVILPSASNGYLLMGLSSNMATSGNLVDIMGRSAAAGHSIDCSTLADGVYTYSQVSSTGELLTVRFALVKN